MSALFLAPFVIADRLPQLWFEALHPNPMVSDESQLIVTEKVAAFGEGIVAAQIKALSMPLDISLAMMKGASPMTAVMRAQRGVAEAAMRPVEKRVRHNAARLVRKLRQKSRSTRG